MCQSSSWFPAVGTHCWHPETSPGSCAVLCSGLSTLQPQTLGGSCHALLGLLLPRSPSRGWFPQLKRVIARSLCTPRASPLPPAAHTYPVPHRAACLSRVPWVSRGVPGVGSPSTPLGFDERSQPCSLKCFCSNLSPSRRGRPAGRRGQKPLWTGCDCPGGASWDSLTAVCGGGEVVSWLWPE